MEQQAAENNYRYTVRLVQHLKDEEEKLKRMRQRMTEENERLSKENKFLHETSVVGAKENLRLSEENKTLKKQLEDKTKDFDDANEAAKEFEKLWGSVSRTNDEYVNMATGLITCILKMKKRQSNKTKETVAEHDKLKRTLEDLCFGDIFDNWQWNKGPEAISSYCCPIGDEVNKVPEIAEKFITELFEMANNPEDEPEEANKTVINYEEKLTALANQVAQLTEENKTLRETTDAIAEERDEVRRQMTFVREIVTGKRPRSEENPEEPDAKRPCVVAE